MPDLERERSRKSPLELFVWLLVPVFRSFPRDAEIRKRNRSLAPRTFLEAILTYALWLVISASLQATDPSSWVWPGRSATLILYFVLTVTSLEALLRSIALAFGASTDRLFERPLLSVSLRDFWGRRWNTFIARFALRHIAMRQKSKTNGPRSVLTVFFWSAVFHEYFALGASGGEVRPGGMLLFFGIQGLGLLVTDRIPWRPPRPAATLLTALWMTFTAPLFFGSLRPPLLELGYPESWFVPTLPAEGPKTK